MRKGVNNSLSDRFVFISNIFVISFLSFLCIYDTRFKMETSSLSAAFWNHMQFLYGIGFFGEIIQLLMVSSLLSGERSLLIVFILGFILNASINGVLKKWFHQKRPSNPIKFLYSEQFSKKSYGMPSGHSQSVFYSIAFLFLARPADGWLLLSLLIGIITVYERWHFHNHTVQQLLAGVLFGSCIGALVFYGYKRFFNNKSETKDTNSLKPSRTSV